MVKFTFADGADICVFDGQSVKKYSSKFIVDYKKNAQNIVRSKQWKTDGDGARFREAGVIANEELVFDVHIGGVFPTEDENEVIYSFSVNQTSGIYKKILSDDKLPETHIINSLEFTFNGGCYNTSDGELVISVQRGYYNSDIALFDIASGDYKTVTDGDTMDEDPYICPDDGNIVYYSSRGVGRDSRGDFACFSASAIYKLDLEHVSVEEVASSPDYNYFKPVYYGGKLYAIKSPVKEKRGNPLLEIVLIPWRILQAIAGFINLFVVAFSGKSLTSGGNNPAKGRDYDSREIVIAGNIVDVEKETKRNASKKDADYGMVPKSWQLIEVDSGKVIKCGVADFDIAGDGTIIITNGRRIFAVKNGKCEKICNTDCCVRVNCRHDGKKKSSPFFFD